MSNVDLITNTTSAKYNALIDQAFEDSGDIAFDRTLYGTRTYSDGRVVPSA